MTRTVICRVALSAVAVVLSLGSMHARALAGDGEPGVGLAGRRLIDLQGRIVRLGEEGRPFALVFLGAECPISNRTLRKLERVSAEAFEKDVQLFAVYSDAALTRQAVIDHLAEYEVALPTLFDGSGELARILQPRRVPEAIVIAEDQVVYRGRIDDRYIDLGKPRAEITSDDLRDAIAAVSNGKSPKNAVTEAVGCLFESHQSAEKPTYAREVAPILQANCVSCHRPGEIGPFALTSYRSASRRAGLLAEVTRSRYMPPWKPVPHFGEFRDELRLSEAEIEVLSRWAETGAPEGSDADQPALATFDAGWHYGEPDLVLTMPEPFTVSAEGNDIYRYFPIPSGLLENRDLVGFDFRPGAKTVLHHAIFYVDVSGRARELDAEEDGPGYPGFGSPRFRPAGILGGWAPGAVPPLLPDGAGILVPKGSDVVLEVHYHPSGKEEVDRSELALYFAKQPVQDRVSHFFFETYDIDIPAGDAEYQRHVELTLPCDLELIGVTPHMHYLGRGMQVTARRPGGSEVPLIRIDDWDFRWQGQYYFPESIQLPKGTRIVMDAVFDNSESNHANPSSPPERVKYGDYTTDEMCLCVLTAIVGSRRDRNALRREIHNARFRDASVERGD
ncbi:MAG: redoxin family protein [Planctomycetota bacterium]